MSKEVTLVLKCNPSELFDAARHTNARALIAERIISAFLGEPGMWESLGLGAYGIELVSRSEKSDQK